MSKILRNETRQDTWQRHLCVHSDVKRFEAPFTTAIMAEKRQELSQMTVFYFIFPMGLWDAISKTLGAVIEQLTYSSKPSKAIHFTNNFQAKAKAWGLSEKDALDVYHHGEQVKDNMIVRAYPGYELGIWYFKDSRTGQPVITSIWKRERR